MTGFDLAEVSGRRPDDLLSGPETTPAVVEQIGSSFNRPVPLEVEILAYHKDRSPHWYLLKLDPVFDERGRLANFICVQTDITERKGMETLLEQQSQALTRSNEDLEQFATIASHDLREPVRMVASFLGLLSERYHGRLDEKADLYIDMAVDAANRMQSLIRSLLEYSRVCTTESDWGAVDVSEVVSRVLKNLDETVQQHGAVVTCDALPTVLGDAVSLSRVFQNLIGNGIKFCTQSSPRVHVQAERNGKTWVFSVRDNGIGIAPEHSDRIFTLFQRLHTREEYPGTGMGLAICKKIVERHGGRIWVKSQPGQGSTFAFTIPVERDLEHSSPLRG
jgi:light-regulated signal transduction histidine kinase (bacteriophytochrome)